jgi:hypothetical protein
MIEADKTLKAENDDLKSRVTQLEDALAKVNATLEKMQKDKK